TFWGADRASDIIAALNLSKAFGLTPIIAGGAEAWRVLKPLKDAGATVILNPLSNLPRSFDALGSRADTATLLHKASIPVVLAATYFNTHNARNLRQVAGNAVRAGLPRDAALRAITLAPATAVGMDKDYGSLDQGKVANLVVWSGDPFAFSSQVEQLYIGGRRVSLDNRQQQLFERYRTIPRRQNVVAPAP
ncbi:MAG: amidohydrolase family protein, partial [Myxococcota bacterium]